MALNSYSLLTEQDCHRARLARDRRFDGQFYIAVKTTGIFCRPICPANLPKEQNVEYFLDQAQALHAGYRPCLRCRPDSAPGSWAWKGTETTFQRAIKLIEQGELTEGSVETLASKLGISDRYLRQLFERYLSMSPKRYAQYHQLMFAKQLLHSSSMSITDIAFASGFNSTRRFNDAFNKVLNLTPSRVRQSMTQDMANRFELSFHGPLDWQRMCDFYALRAIEGIEWVTANSYRRHFKLNDAVGWFEATQVQPNKLSVEFDISDIRQLKHLVEKLRIMFDLNTDLAAVEGHLNHIAPGLVKHSGMRIPGVWNAWEAGVRAILGQQVSVKGAINQLNFLVETLSQGQSGLRQFPSPEQVANADLSFLRMPQSRKDTLHRFATFYLTEQRQDLDAWLELKGIGPWTINYAALRGLSAPNRLLNNDLIVKKMLVNFPSVTVESASPWGSYATFHLWSHSS